MSGFGAAIDTGLTLPTTNSNGTPTIIPGNFNGGPGMQFLAAPGGTTWWVYSFNGSAITGANTGVPVNGEYLAADYDGDGLPDLISVVGTTVHVRRNTTSPGAGVSFATTSTTVWTAPTGYIIAGWGGSEPFQVADFNADGRADLVVSTEHTVTINNKPYQVYQLEVLFSNGFGAGATDYSLPWETGVTFPTIGDWNGDGCSDLITPNAIWISNCAGGFSPNVLNPGLSGTTPVLAVDWDGDGQSDLVYNNGGTAYLIRSTGSGMASPVSLGISWEGFVGVDQNSDGQIDLAYINSSGALAYFPHNVANTPPDLAISISDGFGMNFSPTYSPISQGNYTKESGATFPDMNYDGPMYVVNQFTASDGTGGTYQN
jgi:hypothetical protein